MKNKAILLPLLQLSLLGCTKSVTDKKTSRRQEVKVRLGLNSQLSLVGVSDLTAEVDCALAFDSEQFNDQNEVLLFGDVESCQVNLQDITVDGVEYTWDGEWNETTEVFSSDPLLAGGQKFLSISLVPNDDLCGVGLSCLDILDIGAHQDADPLATEVAVGFSLSQTITTEITNTINDVTTTIVDVSGSAAPNFYLENDAVQRLALEPTKATLALQLKCDSICPQQFSFKVLGKGDLRSAFADTDNPTIAELDLLDTTASFSGASPINETENLLFEVTDYMEDLISPSPAGDQEVAYIICSTEHPGSYMYIKILIKASGV